MRLWFVILHLIMSLLLVVNAGATDPLAGYCFDNTTELSDVEITITPFMLPSDNLVKRRNLNCIELKLSSQRHNLFLTVLKKNHFLTKVYFGHEPSQYAYDGPNSRPSFVCRLEILKLSNLNRNKISGRVGRELSFHAGNEKSESSERMNILVNGGKMASIDINGVNTELGCIAKPRGYFQIKVSISEEISTQVTIRKNQKIDLAGIVKDLSNRDGEISIVRGIAYEKNTGNESRNYYLQVK